MNRTVKIATASVTARFRASPHPAAMRNEAIALVERAGQLGADIVCLPELCLSEYDVGGQKGRAQRVPGPATDAVAELARRHRMYVVAPLVEDAGEARPFNSAVLLDREGKVVGCYRKTHICLPGFQEGEWSAAGDELPVFETDFGRVGMAICMDIHYPEMFTAMALKGAEVIFWPTGCMDYTGDLIESLVNARAVDNQVYFVSSHFVERPFLAGGFPGRSRIVDPMGRTRADTGHFAGLAVAAVDLDETYPMWYQGEMLREYPTMRETLFKTRRPELYGELTQPVQPLHWRRLRTAPGREAGPGDSKEETRE